MPAPASPSSVEGLLRTADLLLAGGVGASAVSRHRGAALALRTALEITVDQMLEARLPGLAAVRSMRAKMLCLRHYAEPATAWRANAVWCHVCLACHYHQYEIGPTHAQVLTWRHEIAALILLLGS